MDEKIKKAREFAVRTQIPGTPAVIVNGKYLVRARSFEDTLRVADALIARERAAGKGR
ncbi:Thiol:disulfide interchange protein DsbA precursor [compost metagenome]